MGAWLNEWDLKIFDLINKEWEHPLLTEWLPWFTNLQNNNSFRFIFVPVLIGLMLLMFRMQTVRLVIALVLAIALADNLGGRVIKPIFNRVRPSNEASVNAIVRVPYRPKSESFPSNHATNSFAVATVFAYYFPYAAMTAYALAFVGAYSRVYVGVHYPLDVTAGAIVGVFWAWLVIWLMNLVPVLRRPERH